MSNEPLKIMDDVERDQHRYAALLPEGCVAVTRPEWQSLRTALERQAEELALVKWHNEQLDKESHEQAVELAQKDARIARFEYVLSSPPAGICEGLADTDRRLEWLSTAKDVLNESPAQSAAHLKAEAIREYAQRRRAEAEEHRASGDAVNLHVMNKAAGIAATEAYEIEREAMKAAFDFERDSDPNGGTLCGKLGRPHKMKRIHHSKTICIYEGCDARL